MSFGSIQAMITSLKNNQRNTPSGFDKNTPKGIGEVKNTGFPERETTQKEIQAWQEQFKKERQRKDRLVWAIALVFTGILGAFMYYINT